MAIHVCWNFERLHRQFAGFDNVPPEGWLSRTQHIELHVFLLPTFRACSIPCTKSSFLNLCFFTLALERSALGLSSDTQRQLVDTRHYRGGGSDDDSFRILLISHKRLPDQRRPQEAPQTLRSTLDIYKLLASLFCVGSSTHTLRSCVYQDRYQCRNLADYSSRATNTTLQSINVFALHPLVAKSNCSCML